MDLEEAIVSRHSVRQYRSERLSEDIIGLLEAEISRINTESGLHIRLVTDDPSAFSGLMPRLIRFKNAVNYFAIIGKDDNELNTKAGYYGEQLVLYSQRIGLNTCWAMICGKKTCKRDMRDGERMVIGIAVGYGENQGVPHSSRLISEVADIDGAPDWFVKGIEFSMLAPTALNKQGFNFEREGDNVRLIGSNSSLGQIDLGIVRYHFECGAGRSNFNWM